jgi:hypothetical protein
VRQQQLTHPCPAAVQKHPLLAAEISSAALTSSDVQPSTSRSTATVRCRSGRVSSAARTVAHLLRTMAPPQALSAGRP